MTWQEELKKQADSFYSGLGDLQSEAGFEDGVNFAVDKMESLLKKQRVGLLEEIKALDNGYHAQYICVWEADLDKLGDE